MLTTLYSLIFNYFHARGNFCCLLITFANSLDPDQDQQQNVGPDLDRHSLTLIVCLKEIFEKFILKKKSPDDMKSMNNYPARKES